MSTADATSLSSIESVIVEALSNDEREVLRRGAVLRYITRDLAGIVTDSAQQARQLVEHPVVDGGDRGRADELWTISEPLRKALVAGWTGADAVRTRVAEATTGLEALYARLAATATRAEALDDLEAEFNSALQAGDVPRAHDLLRLLDEWPVAETAEARTRYELLAPRLRRHSRALPDREATRSYLERGFEQPVWDLLLADGGPWMLHLHGPAGRGKTMFVKNLLGRRCPERDIAVARIDFDYVARLGVATGEPWRLLLAVAAQLDPQLPGSPFRYMLDSYGPLQNVLRPEALPRTRPGSAVDPTRLVDELAIDAAAQVPLKFRTELAAAVGAGHVVVALDTVENVLHTEGAELAPVLAAFGAVVHREDGPDDGVRGLRMIVSGRFDLGEDHPGDLSRQRVPRFRERWVGTAEKRVLGDTTVQIGREVIALEVPGFSPKEVRRFLEARQPAIAPDVIDAIVARTPENPMKLALLAEYVQRNPKISAARITEIDEIDLFYLVDRVVDRIADSRVQWLLRWGALLPVITREALEQVLWPALVAFVDAGPGYDDADAGNLPASQHDVSRWEMPAPETVHRLGARDEAWQGLLEYAAETSWIWVVPELTDTVMLHPDVREPLRRLLRRTGLPVHDDIHRRSFAYWSQTAESADDGLRIAAWQALLFHAYQPWAGAEHDGDHLFRELLDRAVADRTTRARLAREVLALAGQGADGPSGETLELAHLELAEAAIAEADQRGTVVAEGMFAAHLNAITSALRKPEPRRVAFVEAVLAEVGGPVDAPAEAAWAGLDRALRHPAPASDPTHRALMAGWVASRTPPASALDVVRRLADDDTDTQVRQAADTALARGLLAAERWPEAAIAAERAWSAELQAAALIGLADADAVLAGREFPRLWRARARLQRYQPTAALLELGDDPISTAPEAQPAQLLVRGQALALLDRNDGAIDSLGRAASSTDPVASVEAALETSRLMGRTGGLQMAMSHLRRLGGFADPIVQMRARLLTARLFRVLDPAFSRGELSAAEQLAATARTLPPSVAVDLATTRLVVLDMTDERLHGLEAALRSVSGPGARLLALRDLTDVPDAPSVVPGQVDRLRALTGLTDTSPAVAVLARAELERVLRQTSSATRLLDRASASEADPSGALGRAVDRARTRVGQGGIPPGEPGTHFEVFESTPETDEPDTVSLRIGSEQLGGDVLVLPGGPTPAGAAGPPGIVPADVVTGGAYSLARTPELFLQQLGEALRVANLDPALPPGEGPVLQLYLTTEDAAGLPWEAATIRNPGSAKTRPLGGVEFLVRRQQPRPASDETSVVSPAVLVTILNERRDRGQALPLLDSFYDGRAELIVRRSLGETDPNREVPAEARIVHVIADPVRRRRIPALQTSGDDHLTAESLARAVGRQPRLLILDLVLSGSDFDAADQLMIANAFCWQLVRIVPELDVLCGVFAGANDRVDSLRRLVDHLVHGDPLATTVADLQHDHGPIPGGRHPLRDVVSLSSDHVDRRFRLERQP